MKKILFIAGLLFIVGCSDQTSEYKEFVVKYGSNTRTYCDDKGFKMRETFISEKAKAPVVSLINSQECRK